MSSGASQIIPASHLRRRQADAAGEAGEANRRDGQDETAETAAAAPAEPSRADAPAVYVETYGCQMNVADSDLLTGILTGAGYRVTARADDADAIVVNTCAVRERAEERVYARARELAAQKKKRPGVVVSIVGCMAEHLKESLLERAPYVDVIAGPDSYRRMPALLAQARENLAARGGTAQARRAVRARGDAAERGAVGAVGAVIDVKLDKAETYEGLSGAEGGDGVSGFVTIQRGCDKFCTFCVVPFTRGRERGMAPREVLRQARAYADAGYREVVLLGQTVNSYRYEDVGFGDLLRAVARTDGIERIRFTSPYPVDFTDDVIAAIADEPKVCGYVHLPVQSGSDAVLARMRRGYTVADFCAIVDRLRARMPDIAISTDILTGFCGETEDDHAQTLALMRQVRFDSAFMFLYSERDLTHAAKKIPDDVPPAVKKRRLQEIIAVQERLSGEAFAARVGVRERVLIHSRSRRRGDQLVGRTDGFKAVILPGDAGQPGDIVDAVIERATMATLFGRPA